VSESAGTDPSAGSAGTVSEIGGETLSDSSNATDAEPIVVPADDVPTASSKQFPPGAIAGIMVGGVAVVGGLIGLIIFIITRKKVGAENDSKE
jgi:hypothetical protein